MAASAYGIATLTQTVASLMNGQARTRDNILAACELACNDTGVTAGDVAEQICNTLVDDSHDGMSVYADFSSNRDSSEHDVLESALRAA